MTNNLPARFPRRVTTGPITAASTGVSLRGTAHNFMLTRGQASYAMYAARAKVAARQEAAAAKFPTCGYCGAENVEDAGDHADQTGHYPTSAPYPAERRVIVGARYTQSDRRDQSADFAAALASSPDSSAVLTFLHGLGYDVSSARVGLIARAR